MGETTGPNISRTSIVAGYVLAGGRSKRFGQDKARVRLGGEMMLTRTCRLVREVSGSVSVVADRKSRYADSGVRVVEDLWPGEGPLGGILTSLLATAEVDGRRDWNFIVSCDMPFLTREWLTFLIGRALTSRAQVVLAHSAAGPEPLCACWRTDTAETLREALETGVRKVTEGVALLRSEVLDERDWKRFDSRGRLFWNMNTAEDFQQARRIVEADEG
jgi:molybdopterin-guanine dinucleotide biosynthesis protein A